MTLLLAAFSLLLLIHISCQGLALKAAVGNSWTIGARDLPVTPSPLAARFDRALRNFLETAPVFLALMLAAFASDRAEAALVTGGAVTYLAARAAYLPAYAIAVPWVRTVLWQVATLGLVAMLIGVFFP